MSVYLEGSRSVWMETMPRMHAPLPASTTADVVVIGSGIAGLSTAYELAGGAAPSSSSTAVRSAAA